MKEDLELKRRKRIVIEIKSYDNVYYFVVIRGCLISPAVTQQEAEVIKSWLFAALGEIIDLHDREII